MKKLNTQEAMQVNGGWTRCGICKQRVLPYWWAKTSHALKHTSRRTPFSWVMRTAFGIWC